MFLPLHKIVVPEDFFTALQPAGHLVLFFLVVGCMVCIFGKVNMQVFCIFSQIIVCSAELLDHMDIVMKLMQFRYVEM